LTRKSNDQHSRGSGDKHPTPAAVATGVGGVAAAGTGAGMGMVAHRASIIGSQVSVLRAGAGGDTSGNDEGLERSRTPNTLRTAFGTPHATIAVAAPSSRPLAAGGGNGNHASGQPMAANTSNNGASGLRRTSTQRLAANGAPLSPLSPLIASARPYVSLSPRLDSLTSPSLPPPSIV
jgi:hypothetical protein